MIPYNAVVYDLEIIKAIPPVAAPDIEYCAGWSDHANMGISCLWTYNFGQDEYRLFQEDNLSGFEQYASDKLMIGFNSMGFDDRVCRANGVLVNSGFDLLRAIWKATGQPEVYTRGVTRSGYSLDDLAQANLNQAKTCHGAFAPVLWQRGQRSEVISYCLNDVILTVKLLRKAVVGLLADPNDGHLLKIEFPW